MRVFTVVGRPASATARAETTPAASIVSRTRSPATSRPITPASTASPPRMRTLWATLPAPPRWKLWRGTPTPRPRAPGAGPDPPPVPPAPASPETARPHPQPPAQAGQAALGGDLEGVVVEVRSHGIGGFGPAVGRIDDLDHPRALSEDRLVADHVDPRLPH